MYMRGVLDCNIVQCLLIIKISVQNIFRLQNTGSKQPMTSYDTEMNCSPKQINVKVSHHKD